MKLIYLSGPMTGLPDFNYPAFDKAAALFREGGHLVFNPAEYAREMKENEGVFDLKKAMSKYLMYLCEVATTIVLLPGWEQSQGAKLEHAAATWAKLEFIYLP